MCRKDKLYLIPTDIDIRVMVHLLRFFREPDNKLYGSRKSSESQRPLDTVFRQFPFRNLFQQDLDCLRSELLRHNFLPLNSLSSTVWPEQSSFHGICSRLERSPASCM